MTIILQLNFDSRQYNVVLSVSLVRCVRVRMKSIIDTKSSKMIGFQDTFYRRQTGIENRIIDDIVKEVRARYD